jgi:hypothetical protein
MRATGPGLGSFLLLRNGYYFLNIIGMHDIMEFGRFLEMV